MNSQSLILTANPGGASRKYALFRGDQLAIEIHFVYDQGRISRLVRKGTEEATTPTELHKLTDIAEQLPAILKEQNEIGSPTHIGLRIAVPHSYFLEDRVLEDGAIQKLREFTSRAPLAIGAILAEYENLRHAFPEATIIGISDSAFHRTKPDYAWNYGIRLQDADRFEIKRFGYHGLSVASVIRRLQDNDKLPPRVIVVHLGSDASVTAVHGGKSFDTTMGYSPLEGLIMATRVGSIGPTANNVLQSQLGLDDEQMEDYHNNHCGLLGLSETSSALEELLAQEEDNHKAELAIQTYVFHAQKAIGALAAGMAGADLIVFTGTVGERSPVIRQRIIDRLHFLDFAVDEQANDSCTQPTEFTRISRLTRSKPIFVAATDEAGELFRQVQLSIKT